MSEIRIDPRQQFSKKLARWTASFWFIYMIWLSIILLLRPEAALYSVYMGIIATVVMLVNVYAYTRNSIIEKLIFGTLDKTRIELTLGGNRKQQKQEDDSETEGDEEDG